MDPINITVSGYWQICFLRVDSLHAYVLTCAIACKLTCLHVYTVTCVQAYMHVRTCLRAYML